jgi:hypothetical protein
MPDRPAPARRSPGPYRPVSRGSPLLWRSGDRRSRLRRWPPASRRCRCGPAVRHRDDAGDDVLGDDDRQRGSNSGTTQCHCQHKSVAATAFCSLHRIGLEASMGCPRRARRRLQSGDDANGLLRFHQMNGDPAWCVPVRGKAFRRCETHFPTRCGTSMAPSRAPQPAFFLRTFNVDDLDRHKVELLVHDRQAN